MGKISLGRIKQRRVRHNLSDFISLKDYAAKYNYANGSITKLIRKKRVIAYKFGGKWFILDKAPLDDQKHFAT